MSEMTILLLSIPVSFMAGILCAEWDRRHRRLPRQQLEQQLRRIRESL